MFTGPLQSKTYEDLVSFLAQDLPEGVRLDYKGDFPKNLEKTIAAMANTEGGVILIGVQEDGDRPRRPKPGTPIGVEIDQAEERVISKAYQAIREPITPEVQAIPIPPSDGKCVVVVRIQPSERAPHATGGGTDIYRRVDSQSLPADKDLDGRVGIDLLDWMFRRRGERERVFVRALERAEEVVGAGHVPSEGSFKIEIAVQPLFPHVAALDIGQLQAATARRFRLGDYAEYPTGNMRFVSGGLAPTESPLESYVDVSGLTLSVREISLAGHFSAVHPPPKDAIGAAWFYDSIVLFGWSGWVARAAGRGGTYRVTATLTGVKGIALLLRRIEYSNDAVRHRSLQDVVEATIEVGADELAEMPIEVALRLLRPISNAFNWNQREDWLHEALKIDSLPTPHLGD